jgi:hypothetical protein
MSVLGTRLRRATARASGPGSQLTILPPWPEALLAPGCEAEAEAEKGPGGGRGSSLVEAVLAAQMVDAARGGRRPGTVAGAEAVAAAAVQLVELAPGQRRCAGRFLRARGPF